MRAAVISLTVRGEKVSSKIAAALENEHYVRRFAFEKYPVENAVLFSDLKTLTEKVFLVFDAMIFVCACGIAVRAVSPLIRSKLTDPAVVAVDEYGRFAVSLLSGHFGGANALSELIAEKIGAEAVVTTATDTGKKFSPDSFAKANDLHICNIDAAKMIASAVLNGEKIGLESIYECRNIPDGLTVGRDAEYGICISESDEKKPFYHTLNLVPKNISIGVGCRKNTPLENLERFILEMLAKNGIKLSVVRFAASAEIKKDEPALLGFCRKYSIPLRLFTSEQLMSVSGKFESSEFVMRTIGADNVCERSAAADGGKIIVSKICANGMTFAAAINDIDIDFERRIY